MLKRLKQFFESIAYAGLKPTGGKLLVPAAPKKGPFGPIRERIEKYLNSGSANDPLYLTNRTFNQKMRLWLIIGIPAALLLGGLGLVMIGYFDAGTTVTAPPVGLTDAELAQKMLPNLTQNLDLGGQKDVEVQDVHVTHTGPAKLAGVAMSKSNHSLSKVEIVFELTDKDGSRLGAVTTELANLAANSTVPFQFSIEQQNASFALVREIHIR